jgi:hypothetical protein
MPTTMTDLIDTNVFHGSPGYPMAEKIKSITPRENEVGMVEVEFHSGFFTVLSIDELYELQDDGEVHYKESHGGLTHMYLAA